MAERRILALIAVAEEWLRQYRNVGRGIEAAACAIRIRALRDALAALQEGGQDG